MKKAFKHFIVDKNYKSTRLDRFLKKQDQNLPQSLIEKNIRKKKILVNKLKGKSSQILQEGDLVEVFFENKLKDMPLFIIANTTKGKGVSFMENKPIWHYRSPSKEEYKTALKELGF